ncbi:MAG: hypothetical protein ACRDZ2_00905, partial [Ilumatobacteraceae bacterium]
MGLGTLGVIGYTLLGGRSAQGGAGSPQDAVTLFADALAAEDLLAATDLVAPDEVIGVDALVTAVLDRAGAEEVSGLRAGEGADVRIDLVATEVDELGDDAAAVGVEAGIALDARSATGPVGLLLPSNADGEVEVRLITVRLDGRWYVSPLLSIGQLVTEELDLARGDYDVVGDDDTLGVGHDDAEAAIDALLQSSVDLDLEGVIGSVGTGEARFLRVFGDGIDELLEQIPEISLEYEGITVSPLGGGRTAIESAEVSWIDPDEGLSYRLELDDDCLEVSSSDGSGDEACASGDLELLEPLDHRGVVLRTDDVAGGHRVQLVASVADLAAELVAKLPREAMFVAAGAEFADTATSVASGSEVEVDFDGAYQVYELPVSAGVTYIASFDTSSEDDDVYLDHFIQRDDGSWEQKSNVFVAEADGVARLVVSSYADCDAPCLPHGGGSGVLRVQTPAVQQVDFPATLTGELGVGGGIKLTFEVTEQTSATFTVTGDLSMEVRGADGSYVG